MTKQIVYFSETMPQVSQKNDTDIVVVMPAKDILFTQVTLPNLSRHRLREAIPFALEDQLIEDVSELHFALGETDANGTTPVAVVSRKKMDIWLEKFKSLHLSPAVVTSEIFLLPFEENTIHVNSLDNHSVVRTGKYSGFSCETKYLDTLLEAERAEKKIVQTHYSPEELAQRFSADYINLLQKPYLLKRKGTRHKKTWQYAAYLALVWILIIFLSNLISFLMLHHRMNQIDVAIQHITARHFPTGYSGTAKTSMQAKLNQLETEANKNDFLFVLSLMGKNVLEKPGIHLENLNFQHHQMTITLLSDSFDRLDEMKAALSKQGLSVKQQNATIAGTQVRASILISR